MKYTLLIESCTLLVQKLQEIVDEFDVYKKNKSSNKQMYPLKEVDYGYLLSLHEKCKCAPESLKSFIETIMPKEQNFSIMTYDEKVIKIKEFIKMIKKDCNIFEEQDTIQKNK
ncbi:MAG: hypothetical protein Q7I99_07765 [Acholeplasmataceae bacterium]|nr:hypothetical protein [Acholeplasmataceae bacterium]